MKVDWQILFVIQSDPPVPSSKGSRRLRGIVHGCYLLCRFSNGLIDIIYELKLDTECADIVYFDLETMTGIGQVEFQP